MKSILISIHPEWTAKILNGEKTIEIRKTMPKCDLPIDVYIYCTQGGNKVGKYGDGLYHELTNDSHWACGCSWNLPKGFINGKVVAKFTLRKITLYIAGNNMDADHPIGGDAFIKDGVLGKSCLTEEQLLSYTKHNEKRPYDFTFYAWHISDLQIFDEPKDLDGFDYLNPSGIRNIGQRSINGLPSKKHPPQSWCYVEAEE